MRYSINLLSFTAYEITVNETFAVQYIFYLCLVSVGNTALLALITVYFCGIILICGRNFIDLLFFKIKTLNRDWSNFGMAL